MPYTTSVQSAASGAITAPAVAPRTPGARGPVQRTERAPAPDLARGTMLLFIALANASGVVSGGAAAGPPSGSLERLLAILMFAFVHARAYPVFAVMFGYGLVQLAARQASAGASRAEVRAILVRRHLALLAFGALHALLLYYGDFLGAYGIIGLLATFLLLDRGPRMDRIVLWLWAATALEVIVLAGLAIVHPATAGSSVPLVPPASVASLVAPSYGAALVARLAEWPIHTATVVPAIVIVWLGMWAARRRMLEDLERHRRLLARSAGACLALAVAGGLPLGLAEAGVIHPGAATLGLLHRLHEVSGMFGGPGYAALIGVAALALSRARERSVAIRAAGAIRALGERSLSGYLFQSVAWLVLLAPYTLDLAHRFERRLLAAAAIASLTWFTSVVLAASLDRHSRRGPAEAVMKRLTYGRVTESLK